MTAESLNETAGCTPCACGIQEACPDYISPVWLIATIVLVVGFVGLLVLARRKNNTPRHKTTLKRISIAVGIAALIVSTFVGYRIATGKIEWRHNIDSYKQCEQGKVLRSTACEY